MKKIQFKFSITVFSIILLSSTLSYGTIRRVSYWGASTSLDYASLQLAVDASSYGDTIFVYPNSQDWSATITKKLVILGNGYQFFYNIINNDDARTNSNQNTQTLNGYSVGYSRVGNIYLNTGSDGSTLSGLTMLGDSVFINNSSSNTVSRNYFYDYSSILIDGYNSDNSIIGNYFVRGNSILLNSSSIIYSTSSIKINNNIFVDYDFAQITQYGNGFSGEISNNVFGDPYIFPSKTSGGTFTLLTNAKLTFNNNITSSIYFSGGNTDSCNFYNNLGTSIWWNTKKDSVGNQLITVPWTSVFSLKSTDTPDGRFRLVVGSPAIEAGVGGYDCGIFDGTTPYSLSGIPNMPSVYNITGPTNQQSNSSKILNLSISTKSHN